jgi:hypothetical protein
MSLISFFFQIIDEWTTQVRARTGTNLQEIWFFAVTFTGEVLMLA